MEIDKAILMVESLYDRIERDSADDKWKISGPVSAPEREALRTILEHLGANLPAEPDNSAKTTTASAPAILPKLTLNTRAASLRSAEDQAVILCLDFGTAMSKAFAMDAETEIPFGLALGTRAGYTESVYPVPSSVFIGGSGRVFLGHEAIAQSLGDRTPGRERFDSPKQELSQGNMTELSTVLISPAVNPTSTPLNKEELITLYLAYLTDLAGTELSQQHKISRYVRRRFARPAWDPRRTAWAENLLKRMLARAQILADTFEGQWSTGLDVRVVRAAFDLLSAVDTPSCLIAEGVPEPVAAASSLVVRGEPQRRGFLVVDVGAGTTDLGLFTVVERQDLNKPKIFQVPNSISSPRMAGDTIDNILRGTLLKRHGVDLQSAYGQRIASDLSNRIRGFKETLFRDGELRYNLADDDAGKISLGEFMAIEEVHRFSSQLQQKIQETFDAIHASWLEGIFSHGVSVVLTGGGARLDMIQELAKGTIASHGVTVLREPVDPSVPEWITEEYPQFGDEYPQLAVAMGGASPRLAEVGPETPTFGGGLKEPTYVSTVTYR